MNYKVIFKNCGVLVIFILVLLACQTAIFAQELKGKITDERNKPIYRAHIQLLRDGVIKNRAFTDWRGNYHIWPIAQGGYQALISVDGYDRIIRDINIKTIDTMYVHFAMHKKSSLLSK